MTARELAPVIRDALAHLRVDRAAGSITLDGRTVARPTSRELRWELSTAIYELWHSGRAMEPAGHDLRRDRRLEASLVAAVPHRTTRTEAVLRSRGDGQVVVEVGRVRVSVPGGLVADSACRVGDQIALPLPAVRPCLSPGFLLVDGEAGTSTGAGAVLRLYAHITAGDATPRFLGAALRTLETSAVRYRAKVVSRSAALPRRDALVVYLGSDAIESVPDLVRELASLPGIGEETPLMAHRVAPGISLAWEPNDTRPGWDRMSFGQHRATAVADGILRHMSDGQPLPEAVWDALRDASADPAQPARNVTSPALPAVEAGRYPSEVGAR